MIDNVVEYAESRLKWEQLTNTQTKMGTTSKYIDSNRNNWQIHRLKQEPMANTQIQMGATSKYID